MSAVEVEISGGDVGAAEAPPPSSGPPSDDAQGPEARGPEPSSSAPPPRDPDAGRERRSSGGPAVEIEREVTKRQLIESITTILVVVLYMVFTLVRERESGVIVIDPDGRDDWDE